MSSHGSITSPRLEDWEQILDEYADICTQGESKELEEK